MNARRLKKKEYWAYVHRYTLALSIWKILAQVGKCVSDHAVWKIKLYPFMCGRENVPTLFLRNYRTSFLAWLFVPTCIGTLWFFQFEKYCGEVPIGSCAVENNSIPLCVFKDLLYYVYTAAYLEIAAFKVLCANPWQTDGRTHKRGESVYK